MITHPTDINEVFQFGVECDISEYGEPDSSMEDLQRLWADIDPQKDAWIARNEDGKVVGFSCISNENKRLHIDVYLHLERTPVGVEDKLVKAALERGKNLSNSTEILPMVSYTTGVNKRLQQAFERAGFSLHTYHYRMQINFSEPVEGVLWPGEYAVSSFKPEDEQELFELVQEAFDRKSDEEGAREFWRSLLFRDGNYDPKYFVLVRQAGRLVGCALGYLEEQGGWIRQLAVAKEMQGKGLGGLLLRHMFHLFHQAGAGNTALGVAAKNENAVTFYERNGMHRTREFLEYWIGSEE